MITCCYCGGTPNLLYYKSKRASFRVELYVVVCKSCGARTLYHRDESIVKDMWNRGEVMELVKGEKGRYIKIDGKKVKVESCRDCPCFAYDRSGDGPWCKHPLLENAVLDEDCKIGRGCPLREVNE